MVRRIGGYIGAGVTDLSSLSGNTNTGGATGVWDVIQQNFYKLKSEWPFYGPVSVTGGNIAEALAPGNGYKYHTFTNPGSFSLDNGFKTVDILVVAGGGSGGLGYYGGGGGAGGVIYYPNLVIGVGSYAIEVGLGGSPNTTQNGGNSSFGTSADLTTHLVALGGGYGGPRNAVANSGGSGGGVGQPGTEGLGNQKTDVTIPEISRTYGYGSDGGPSAYGAGGGGALTAGGNGPNGTGGVGYSNSAFDGPLIGIPALDPYNGTFAGGGGGGQYPTSSGGYLGGPGGGGNGGIPSSPGGKDAVQYTGSGGGGGWGDGAPSGAGAQGIVVIRYAA